MNRLHTLIDGFSRVRILCIGDVMLDKFLYGSVSRISPEAPVPIMKMDRETRMLGGAGNVVSNLCALGCRTTFISVVGDDGHGRQVRRFLEETHCVPELVECEGYETTVKIRFVAGNRLIHRSCIILDRTNHNRFIAAIRRMRRNLSCQALMLSLIHI